jgi:NTE family protein
LKGSLILTQGRLAVEKKNNPDIGLILSGGGARGAYQVGVLKAIAEIVPPRQCNPFPIICGTSAGAITAAALASNAHRFRLSVRGLENIWSHLTVDQVFRTEIFSFLWMLMRWLIPGFTVGYTPHNTALLDSTPLRNLLQLVVNRRRIRAAIRNGDLKALCITASSYGNGESVTFFQASREIAAWSRARRFGRPAAIGVEHLLASSAIPLLFPAQRIDDGYYGDGALRQLAPLSPAIHLGAEKILVIGVSGNTTTPHVEKEQHYPSMAQVLGHILNSVFVDTLEGDVERLERINHTLAALTPEERQSHGINLKPVEVLKVYPSQPIDSIAAAHMHELPRSLRFFLRGSGGTRATGASAVSYLLFQPGFCQALIELGYRDGLARREQIARFLNLENTNPEKTSLEGSARNDDERQTGSL